MFYYLVFVSSNPICHSNYLDSQEEKKERKNESFSSFLKTISENINMYKKSLKIPKGSSESIHRRRTYNTMVKRK